ncbi:MAG: ABC transporter ATP-binding protein, partial [Pseudomonadota bacterium]
MFAWFERRLSPFPDTRKGAPPKRLWPFLRHYVRDAFPGLAIMTVLSAAIAIGEVMLFAFLGQIVDWLADADKATFLADKGLLLALMAFGVVVALPLAHLVWGLVVHQGLWANLPMSARWRMHGFLLGQSMAFFANEYAGRVGAKLMQTALAVREVVMKVLDVFVYTGVFFLTMMVLVASADWRLAAPLFVWLLAYAALTAYFVPRLTKVSEAQADARSVMTGRVVDSYTNISIVKLFAHAGGEEAYAKASMTEFLATVHRQMRLVTAFYVLVHLNNAAAVLAVGGLGVWFWSIDLVTVGAVAVAVGLALRVIGMSQWVMWEVSALFENIGVVYDGMAMLSQARAVEDKPDAVPLKVTEGAIALDAVSFHYGKDKGVIEGLSLTVRGGEKVGLVGRSGAGKSTLVNLLLRLYDVEGGAVRIDGQDIRDVAQDSLRARIGMVTQDTSLLHRSIRENIAYGRPDATDAEIDAAMRKARADAFISDLEDHKGQTGLDAEVGERGVKLSGGQRQRIAIARIFLKDAPILVLDEATSALD